MLLDTADTTTGRSPAVSPAAGAPGRGTEQRTPSRRYPEKARPPVRRQGQCYGCSQSPFGIGVATSAKAEKPKYHANDHDQANDINNGVHFFCLKTANVEM